MRFLLANLFALLLLCLAGLAQSARPDTFDFVILGDRTGETRPGVYEQVLREAAKSEPAFILSVGDTIQGLDDAAAPAQWAQVKEMLSPYRQLPMYLAPGNHDVWSPFSERLYREFSGRPLHYGFDYGKAHFTVLDNSRSEELQPAELDFLESDLKSHAAQPLKFIVSHRPSWVFQVLLRDTSFRLQHLAKQYSAQYVVAGHVHQMLHAELDRVAYLSMPSAGGHLRASGRYEDGWFFGHTLVKVRGGEVDFQIREAGAPAGAGRATGLAAWGTSGLVAR